MSRPPQRLNDDELLEAAKFVAMVVDQAGPLRRIHRQANGLFRTGYGSVIRVACSDQDWTELSVQVAELLERQGKKAIRLDPRVPGQPISVMGTLATVWQDVGPQRADVRAPAPVIGALLRDLHTGSVPDDVDIPVWNPLPEWRDRVGKAKGLTPDERRKFNQLIDTLEADRRNLEIPMTSLIHLDPEPSNVLWDGKDWVWCDFDNFRKGPPEADLAASWAGENCFKRVGEFSGTMQGYGLDRSPSGPIWNHCVRTKLLFHAMAGLPHATTHGFARAELSRRLNDVFEGGDFAEKESWTPFARMVERDRAADGPHVLANPVQQKTTEID